MITTGIVAGRRPLNVSANRRVSLLARPVQRRVGEPIGPLPRIVRKSLDAGHCK
jgi:hypothetical protein